MPIRSAGNADLKEESVDAYELGYTGVVANGRAIAVRGVLREQDEERHLLHRADGAALDGDQPAAQLRVGRCRPRSSR